MNQKMSNANVQGISRTVVDPVTKKTVISVTFLRENGLFIVKAKSDIFEKYFKNQSINPDYGGDEKWHPTRTGFKEVVSYGYSRPNDHDMFTSIKYWGESNEMFFNSQITEDLDVPNMSWVRAKDLSKGIKVCINGSPIDGKKFNLYCDKTMQMLGKMYNKYMTPKQSKGKITIKSEHIR